MADPARKPRPEIAPDAPVADAPAPRLRPRHLREAEVQDAPAESGARSLQARLTDAFTRRSDTKFEALLMRLIIVAATCCVLANAIAQGGPIAGLFR